MSGLGNRPAFPNITPDMNVDGGPGLSLRQYYAGQMMAALIQKNNGYTHDRIAEESVICAEALIAELEKP